MGVGVEANPSRSPVPKMVAYHLCNGPHDIMDPVSDCPFPEAPSLNGRSIYTPARDAERAFGSARFHSSGPTEYLVAW